MNSLTSWKDLFEAALIESDPARLPERIEQAKTAILERVDQVDDPRTAYRTMARFSSHSVGFMIWLLGQNAAKLNWQRRTEG